MTIPNTLNSRALALALEFAGSNPVAGDNPVEEPSIEVTLWTTVPVKCQGKEVSITYSLKFTTAPRMDMKGNVEKVHVRVHERYAQYVLSTEFDDELGEVGVEHFWRAVEYANSHTDSFEVDAGHFNGQYEVKAWAEDIVQAYFKRLVSYLMKQKRAKEKGENK